MNDYKFINQDQKSRFNSVIWYILTREYKLMIFEENTVKNSELDSFLNNVLSQPGNESIKCALETILSLENTNENRIGFNLALQDFQSMKNKHVQSINSNINADKVDDKVAHNLCVSLLNLCYSKPGIFFTILPLFDNIIKCINPERSNKIAGSESLFLYSNPDIEAFKKLKIDQTMILLYFQYPVIFSNLPFCRAMQSKFTSEFEYPKVLPMCDASMSFLNTTIEQNIHFLDTVSLVFKKFIQNSDDYSNIPDSVNIYPRILPLLILAHQPLLYKDLNKSLTLFQREFIPSVSSEIIARFRNDQEIINVISFMKSDEISPDELLSSSLPFLLQFSLSNPQLLKYSEMKFYLIDDADSQTDFDFIKCYQLLRTFLSCFQKPTNTLEQNIQKMNNLIDSISSKATQSFILFDLFSLIFLVKDDNYVCHQFVAEKLVQLIAQFDDSPYIQGAISILSKPKPKKKDPPNLQVYFERNHGKVYRAIEEQNWNLANQLTEFNPYFRKLYNRAFSVSLIESNHAPPADLEKDYNHALFEYSLSNFNQDVLQKEFLHFSTFSDYVKNRLKFKDANELMSCFPNREKYAKAVENAIEIEEKIADCIKDRTIENYVQSFSVSENLLLFINNLELYFNCVKIGEENLENISNEDLFKFDLKKALSRPFNNGDYQMTEDFANLCKINLFQFIVQNLSLFVIKEKYLSKTINEYLYESICLAYENGYFDFLRARPKLPKSVRKYIDDMQPRKDVLPEKSDFQIIIELIKSKKYDEIDDYLYRVDHQKLYEYLIQNIEASQFPNELVKILDVIEYTSPESDEEKLKTIHTFNTVHQITKETVSTRIITDLMKKDLFNVAVDYIKIGIPQKLWGPPVIHLFSLCLKNPDRIDSMLVEFSSRFDLIESRFFHVRGIIPHLLKHCPPDKEKEVHALSLFPEEIRMDSNVFDFNTVVEAFARHPKSIFKLNAEMMSIFTDENIIYMIEKVESSPDFNKILPILYGLCKNKEAITGFFVNKIYDKIQKISVNSVEDEDEVISSFDNLNHVLAVLPNSDNRIQKVNCIIEFINYHPFLRWDLSYSFELFATDSFPKIFINYLRKIDLFDLTEKISVVFNIDISELQILRLNVLLLTHDIKGVSEVLNSSKYKIEIDRTDPKGMNYDRSYYKLHPLTKMSIFDKDVFETIRSGNLELNNLPPLFVYQRIKVTKKAKLDKERYKILPTFFRKAFSIKPCISLLVSHKFLDIAYQVLMSLNENEEFHETFIWQFIKSALCSDYIQKTEQFLIAQDPTFLITKSLWDDLVDFFEKHDMYNSLYKVYIIKNQPEEAAKVKLKLFNEEPSLLHKIALIGHAIYCLTNAIHNMNKSKAPMMSKIEEITKEKSMLEFLLKICEFCNERELPFSDDYNLLIKNEDHSQLAVLLFINGEKELLSEFIKYEPITFEMLGRLSAEKLSTMKFNDIVKFVKIIINTDRDFAFHFLDMLLMQMSFSKGYAMIIPTIMTFYRDTESQCKKLIEFDFLTEAFSIMSLLGKNDLAPLAAHRAAQLGKVDLFLNFQSLLK